MYIYDIVLCKQVPSLGDDFPRARVCTVCFAIYTLCKGTSEGLKKNKIEDIVDFVNDMYTIYMYRYTRRRFFGTLYIRTRLGVRQANSLCR